MFLEMASSTVFIMSISMVIRAAAGERGRGRARGPEAPVHACVHSTHIYICVCTTRRRVRHASHTPVRRPLAGPGAPLGGPSGPGVLTVTRVKRRVLGPAVPATLLLFLSLLMLLMTMLCMLLPVIHLL